MNEWPVDYLFDLSDSSFLNKYLRSWRATNNISIINGCHYWTVFKNMQKRNWLILFQQSIFKNSTTFLQHVNENHIIYDVFPLSVCHIRLIFNSKCHMLEKIVLLRTSSPNIRLYIASKHKRNENFSASVSIEYSGMLTKIENDTSEQLYIWVHVFS